MTSLRERLVEETTFVESERDDIVGVVIAWLRSDEAREVVSDILVNALQMSIRRDEAGEVCAALAAHVEQGK